MDHDSLFKQLLTTFFGEFVELFLPELSAYLARETIEFVDKEIFTDLAAGQRHEVDLLVKAKFNQSEAFFLVHVESQATAQDAFAKRMFRYFARLHEKFDLPVYPIALLSYDSPQRPEPDTYEVSFPDRLVLHFAYRVIQLNRLDWRDFIRRPNPVAAALMAKMRIAPEDRPRVRLEFLRMVATLRLDPARVTLLKTFMLSYLKLTPDEESRYNAEYQRLDPAEKRAIVEVIDPWVQQGMARGALRVLAHKFGQMPLSVSAQIEALPPRTLDNLMDALLDFKTIQDVENWLSQEDSGH